MDECKLLDTTLEILGSQGVQQAYHFISQNQSSVIISNRSQIYNYLYCLAAVSGEKEASLSWLEEAIITKGYWYRPEVFEDSDLDILCEEERFLNCKLISEQRYLATKNVVQTQCTWTGKTSDKILLALHGNQQNIQICKPSWEFMKENGYQVEYIQSCELDSYELYRWEDEGNGAEQLNSVCNKIDWNSYHTRILGGFSAGCNVILKSILENKVISDYIILQSPWIPVIHEEMDNLIMILKQNKTKILVICGDCDEDCTPLAQLLYQKAFEEKLDIQMILEKGMSHSFSENFQDIVNKYFCTK